MLNLIVFGAIFLLVDQWSKRIVRSSAIEPLVWGRFLQVRYVTNTNQLWNSINDRAALCAIWFAALGSAIALRFAGLWFRSPTAMAGLGCALGGAAGNLIDIARRNCVVDFIDLGWWPVFNLADLGIVLGLILAFCY